MGRERAKSRNPAVDELKMKVGGGVEEEKEEEGKNMMVKKGE